MKDDSTNDTGWLKDARFGLFIHWGLYSVPARQVGKNSTAEWIKSNERLSDEEYDAYFAHFDPDLYDPAVWAREASNAGMRYFVVTTKHHEGFCLWDSQLTDYKATNTPAKRDLLRPMVEAFREEGLRVGFYHSLLDWHHPEFQVDGFHPQRDDEEFKQGQFSLRHGQVQAIPPWPGPRAAHRLRQDRLSVLRLLLSARSAP